MATYGHTFTSGDTVTPTKLNNARTVSEIVNADIKSDAAIAFSKLAQLDSANILVGNASNVATKVAVTGDVTLSNAGVATLSRPFTLAASQASNSGTSIDFTSIPSYAKRITIMLVGVSTNGTNHGLIQIGDSGGIETSGYLGTGAVVGATTGSVSQTSGFALFRTGGAIVQHGIATLALADASTNTWVYGATIGNSDAAFAQVAGGSKSLSATLDRVRITTVGGTDTFDAGIINISYEG